MYVWKKNRGFFPHIKGVEMGNVVRPLALVVKIAPGCGSNENGRWDDSLHRRCPK